MKIPVAILLVSWWFLFILHFYADPNLLCIKACWLKFRGWDHDWWLLDWYKPIFAAEKLLEQLLFIILTFMSVVKCDHLPQAKSWSVKPPRFAWQCGNGKASNREKTGCFIYQSLTFFWGSQPGLNLRIFAKNLGIRKVLPLQ